MNSSFKQANNRFECGEEYHLADVFLAGIKHRKLTDQQFINWIKYLDINSDMQSNCQFNNLKSFCLYLYVKLNSQAKLSDSMKIFIEENFSEVY